MSRSKEMTRAFKLSLTAGILILINTTLLGVAATWFPGIIPTIPGLENDTAVLHRLTAAGLTFGVLVLFGALMLRARPANNRAWGTIIVVFSIPSVLTGGGFIIGWILGTIGGASAIRRPKTQATEPAKTT